MSLPDSMMGVSNVHQLATARKRGEPLFARESLFSSIPVSHRQESSAGLVQAGSPGAGLAWPREPNPRSAMPLDNSRYNDYNQQVRLEETVP
jgi:hypothetical protein